MWGMCQAAMQKPSLRVEPEPPNRSPGLQPLGGGPHQCPPHALDGLLSKLPAGHQRIRCLLVLKSFPKPL